jgi:4-amino-4-deoxy-L-arabinose transferase-like glycosyltransferase
MTLAVDSPKPQIDVAQLAHAQSPPRLGDPTAGVLGYIVSRAWLSLTVLSLLCVLFFFYGLGAGELYRTEGLRAILAQECLRSANWVVPKLYGEPFFTKPPCMYAAIALVSWPHGHVSEWSARLPSAIAATATVFLFYWYFTRSVGRLAGFIAAFILPLSPSWFDKASAAELDMMQVAWVTASILFFLRGLETWEGSSGSHAIVKYWSGRVPVEENETGVRSTRSAVWLWWPSALCCVAGGTLTKWTAPAFFYATVVPLLWWRGRLRLLWSRYHVLSAILACALCLTWVAGAVWLEGWQVFYETVRREALVHLSPQHHLGGYSISEMLLHPIKIGAANLPWSLLALVALRPGFAASLDTRGRRLIQALHCWLWPNLLFWSFVPQHSIRHAFPLFPAISGLAAIAWVTIIERTPDRLTAVSFFVKKTLSRVGIILMALAVTCVVARVTYVHAVIPSRDLVRKTRAKGERISSLVPADQTLYLLELKDDGLMFYYDRDVKRLTTRDLHSGRYCLLTAAEWELVPRKTAMEVIDRLEDQQGAPIVLVRQRNCSNTTIHP